jgi:putative hydrolase of the HAD superfamily
LTIRLVTLDFWQTLLADTPVSSLAAQALRLGGVQAALAAAGHRYEPAALEAGDGRALAALDAFWRTHRDVSPPEQVRIFLEALDPGLSRKLPPEAFVAVARAYAEPVLTHQPVVAAGAVEAIRALAVQGIALGVISNTGRTPGVVLRRLLERAGVLSAFAVLSFSDEVGVRKPATEIFRRTLALAGVPAEAGVHVGDDPVNDVEGARAAGMRALHYVPDGGVTAEAADGVVRHFDELPARVGRLP